MGHQAHLGVPVEKVTKDEKATQAGQFQVLQGHLASLDDLVCQG